MPCLLTNYLLRFAQLQLVLNQWVCPGVKVVSCLADYDIMIGKICELRQFLTSSIYRTLEKANKYTIKVKVCVMEANEHIHFPSTRSHTHTSPNRQNVICVHTVFFFFLFLFH